MLYSIGLFIKDCLVWMMPVTIICFIASTVASFEKKAPFFVLALFLFEGVSNFSSVWYAYFCASIAERYLPIFSAIPFSDHFEPLWRLRFNKPAWWSPDKGALVGLIIGCFDAYSGQSFPTLKLGVEQGRVLSELLLTRVFSKLIPLFILGFASHIYQTGLLGHLILHYGALIFWILVALIFYLLFLYALGAHFCFSVFRRNLSHLAPAGLMALTSGCSLSTMPWTLKGVEKSLISPKLGKAVIPATTNIQQVGDCIVNAFLCAVIFRSYHGHIPDFNVWLKFSVAFSLARFATAAVLGGAIFIMLPIYESYLGFTPEMLGIILAFNVVLDSIVTSSNVMGNGALCILFEKFWRRILLLLS